MPVLEQIRAAERTCKKASPLSVLLVVDHVKDSRSHVCCTRDSAVPVTHRGLCSSFVNLRQTNWVIHGNLIRRDADVSSVGLVETVDIVYPLTGADGGLEAKVREACDQWTGNFIQWIS